MNEEIKLSSTRDILNKLKIKLGFKKSNELAKFIGVKPNTISSWIIRDSMPCHILLEICLKYNIDLNYLFFENSFIKSLENNYVKVPILYIHNYWDYYFNPIFKNTEIMPVIYLLKDFDFDIVIEIAVENEKSLKSKILFTFCKKVSWDELKIEETYIFLVKDKGFLYAKLVAIDFDLNFLQLDLGNKKSVNVDLKDSLELFLCKGFYNHVQ
ncbi:helix-turn-helix domain-containing protein [Myroides odoratus]|uniref:helix-turn-helix domain-containing protein n=1 Tax=Myroides odoratus TaxID=256 RepID=UPI000765DC7D|nr:helix-turn-helix domain-containing protein [Myroides odoratus]